MSSGGASSSTSASGTSGSTGGSSAVEQFCAAVIPQACAIEAQCQTFDSDCTSLAATALLGLPNGCSAPGLTVNPAFASRCLGAMEQIPDGGCTALQQALAGPCSLAVRGSTPEGHTCNSDLDCAPRPDGGLTSCVAPSSGICGVCTAGEVGQYCLFGRPGQCIDSVCWVDFATCVPYVGDGGRCGETQQGAPLVCQAGDYCAADSHCHPTVADGAPCSLLEAAACASPDLCIPEGDGGGRCGGPRSAGQPCFGSASFCVADDLCAALPDGGSLCAPGPTAGQPCTNPDHLCDPNPALGLVCDPTSSLCLTAGAPDGGLCSTDPYFACGAGLGCRTYDGGALGQCVPTPLTGQSCDDASQLHCLAGLAGCEQGTCEPAPSSGEPCGDAGAGAPPVCRAGDVCDGTGVCRALAALGSSCTAGLQPSLCGQGYCASSASCLPFLAPGSPCDPGAFECGSTTTVVAGPDGGLLIADPLCTLASDGGYTCGGSCD